MLDVEAEAGLAATGFLTESNGLRFAVVEVNLMPGLVAVGVDELDCGLSSDDPIFAFFAGGSSTEAVARRVRSGGMNFFIARLLTGVLCRQYGRWYKEGDAMLWDCGKTRQGGARYVNWVTPTLRTWK